ncbi:MAG: aminotransferase class V-fold PLP-dependent enzyme [Acidimicrobiales bacterium]|jgi:selenocysteine lyase/cysteine desulfurase
MMNVEQLRAATPGCAERIHLNNAGAALVSAGVLQTQVEHLELEARIGGYEAASEAADRVAAAYTSVAGVIGARAHQIAMVDNATTAWNLAFLSIELEPGDKILTSEAEYAANYVAYLNAQRRFGAEIGVVPSDAAGQLDVTALDDLIDDRTKLISITHIPTNGGLINPAEEVGAVAQAHGVTYLLDACQSVGQLELDVDALGCDFLSATGRKYLRGPRGTGFLYASDKALQNVQPAVLDHHGGPWTEDVNKYVLRPDARRFENWEFGYAGLLGLGTAADEALALGLDAIEERVVELGRSLRSKLAAADFETYDIGDRQCGIVTTLVPNVDSFLAKQRLTKLGINASVSMPESTRIDALRRALPDLLRLSVHYYNTDDELDAAVSGLTEIRTTA